MSTSIKRVSATCKKNAANDPCLNDRFSACHVLREGGLSCYVWCEDALSHFGVRTGVFGLYLLVNDTDVAANLLTKHGWVSTPIDFQAPYNDIKEDTRYLVKAEDAAALDNSFEAAQSIIGLLSAADWKVQLPAISLSQAPKVRDDNLIMPPLSELLEAVIDKWLDAPDSQPRFHERLGLFLAYLYRYVPALRLPEFAQHLRVEHQPYHKEVTSGLSTQGWRFREHSRKCRDDVIKGSSKV